MRLKKIALGYSDGAPATPTRGKTETTGVPGATTAASATSAPAGPMLWWCDGPSGAAKAAITAQAKESLLVPLDLPSDAKQIVAVVKAVAEELKAGSAASAVLCVQNAAVAMVFANRCPSIRAVVGTCLEAVEQGIQFVAANVLVIEHPHKSLPQIKSMLSRFARAKRELSPDVQRQLAELANCG